MLPSMIKTSKDVLNVTIDMVLVKIGMHCDYPKYNNKILIIDSDGYFSFKNRDRYGNCKYL